MGEIVKAEKETCDICGKELSEVIYSEDNSGVLICLECKKL